MFFFSSRRRHTRLVSDWSSDVCSSDLAATYAVPVTATAIEVPGRLPLTLSASVLVLGTDPAWYALLPGTRIVATGRLAPGRPGDLTAAVLSVSGPPDEVGTAPWVQRAAEA